MILSGKTALLTGASRGLGRELAVQLDASGCRLLLVARDRAQLASLQTGLQTEGSRCFPHDLSTADERRKLIGEIASSESQLDLLIHNAGIGSHSKLDQLTSAEIQQVLNVNTLAPFELTAGLLPLLKRSPAAGVVAIGSLAGEMGVPGMSLYSSSKAALHAFTRACEYELAAEGHFCLLVVLGTLRNPHFQEAIRNPAQSQPGWYRRLDVEPAEAARQILRAIEQRRSRLVIPGWYRYLLALNTLAGPLAKHITQISYKKLRQDPDRVF